MYDKYIKIDREHYVIGNSDIELIKSENEEDLTNYLQTQNELETAQINLEKYNNKINQIKSEDKARKIMNIAIIISILLTSFIICPSLGISIFDDLTFKVLLGMDIFGFFFLKTVSTVAYGLKHTNKRKLDKLVKQQETLTNKIKELNQTLTELKTNNKIQKKENNDIKTIIKPMNHDNTEVKPFVKKRTNN